MTHSRPLPVVSLPEAAQVSPGPGVQIVSIVAGVLPDPRFSGPVVRPDVEELAGVAD